MLEISVVEDRLSNPGEEVVDLMGNVTTLLEAANINLERFSAALV